MSPVETVERALAEHGQRQRGAGAWTCPAHEDRRPSLSVDQGDDGRALVYCHRGCTVAEVVAAVGLRLRDLHPADGRGRHQPMARRQEGPPLPAVWEGMVAEWAAALDPDRLELLAERRGLSARTVRVNELGWDGVCFTLPVRDTGGRLVNVRRWRPNALAGEEKYLGIAGHNSMRLYPSVPGGRYALVVEGEFDALIGRQHHLPAVTSTGGAGKWRREWSGLFKGMQVWVVPDCDQAGREGAEKVAASLHAAGATVHMVDLGLPDKGDLTDWFLAGRTVEELRERLRSAPRWRPPPPTAIRPPGQVDPPMPRRVPAPGAASDEASWEAARIADAGVVPTGAVTVEPGPLAVGVGAPAGPDDAKPAGKPMPSGARVMAFPSERARALYLALALKSREDEQGHRVQENVGHEQLSRAFDLSKPTIERELRRLDRLGFLTRERRFAPGPEGGIVNAWTRYVLHLEPAAARTAVLDSGLEVAVAEVVCGQPDHHAITEPTMPSPSPPCHHRNRVMAWVLLQVRL